MWKRASAARADCASFWPAGGREARELEAAHLIQSIDRILDVAIEAGRNMERQRETTIDESVRGALQEQPRKTEEPFAKDDAQKQDDPAPPKDRDR
jgi:hypothetical protein